MIWRSSLKPSCIPNGKKVKLAAYKQESAFIDYRKRKLQWVCCTTLIPFCRQENMHSYKRVIWQQCNKPEINDQDPESYGWKWETAQQSRWFLCDTYHLITVLTLNRLGFSANWYVRRGQTLPHSSLCNFCLNGPIGSKLGMSQLSLQPAIWLPDTQSGFIVSLSQVAASHKLKKLFLRQGNRFFRFSCGQGWAHAQLEILLFRKVKYKEKTHVGR